MHSYSHKDKTMNDPGFSYSEILNIELNIVLINSSSTLCILWCLQGPNSYSLIRPDLLVYYVSIISSFGLWDVQDRIGSPHRRHCKIVPLANVVSLLLRPIWDKYEV